MAVACTGIWLTPHGHCCLQNGFDSFIDNFYTLTRNSDDMVALELQALMQRLAPGGDVPEGAAEDILAQVARSKVSRAASHVE